jgi:spore coat protein CotH
MRGRWIGLAGLLACTETEEIPGAGPEIASEPTVHIGDSWLFSTTRINRIELEIDDDAAEILRAERRFSYPRRTAPAQATIDGEQLGRVGVRLRGGLGSFQRFDQKPKLELDLNDYTGERFYGLESLSLNNMIQDCSGVREALAYAAYGQLGLPTSRTGFAQLFVNGLDYGLMLVLETQDDRWLKRNFVDGDGNLYDGKYVTSGFWPKIVDFDSDRDHWFDLEEGLDVNFADIGLISEGVKRSRSSESMDPELREMVNWEQFLTLMRAEQWTGNTDSYGTGPNNYRVYFEPGQPLVMSPWDTDAAFPGWFGDGKEEDEEEDEEDQEGSDTQTEPELLTGMNPDAWEDPGGSLLQVCLDDTTCRTRWEDLEEGVVASLQDGSLVETMDAISVLTEEGKLGDPRAHCEKEQVLWERGSIRAYLVDGSRSDELIEEGCSATGRRPASLLVLLALVGLVGRRREQTGESSG